MLHHMLQPVSDITRGDADGALFPLLPDDHYACTDAKEKSQTCIYVVAGGTCAICNTVAAMRLRQEMWAFFPWDATEGKMSEGHSP